MNLLKITLCSICFACMANACSHESGTLRIPQLVKVETVKSHNSSYKVSYPGKIAAASDVKLSFRVAGPIKKIYVNEGDKVKEGQLLAEIDPRDYQLQYDAVQAEYSQIKEESGRIIELYHRNSVAVNDYDKAVAALKRVTAQYNATQNMLNDTKLKAPFSGYIQNRYFDAHEIVNQGTPILSVIDEKYFEVYINIPSSDYIRRKEFVSFFCTPDVYSNEQIPLELLEVNRKSNFNQLFKVRFRLKKENALQLAPGMSVNVVINYLPEASSWSVIPTAALFQKEGASYVWRYDNQNQTVKMCPVAVIQLLKTGEAIVDAQLAPGESIVSAGVNSLQEGQKVKKLPPLSSSNIGGLL